MMVVVFLQEGSLTPTAPEGWTQLFANAYNPAWNHYTHGYYKLAGSSEPANYTWDLSSTRRVNLGLVAFRGVSAIGNYGTQNLSSKSTSVVAPAITMQSADNWTLVAATSQADTSFTAPTNYTEHIDIGQHDLTLAMFSWHRNSTGSTGTVTATSAATNYGTGIHIELVYDTATLPGYVLGPDGSWIEDGSGGALLDRE
jgi:hypothetical protein